MSHLTAEDLRQYVGASASDIDFLDDCLTESEALVSAYTGETAIPQVVYDNSVLHVGSELYHRRSAPSGYSQFAAYAEGPVRLARDPMQGVYAVLQRYVKSGV